MNRGRPALAVGQRGEVDYEQRGDRVQARARAGVAAGGTKRVSATGDTKEEALALLDERVAKLALRSTTHSDTELTLGALLDLYLERLRRERKVLERSVVSYERRAGYAKRLAGGLTVVDLEREHLQTLLDQVEDGYSLSAAHGVRTVVTQALDLALDRRMLAFNPMRSVPALRPIPAKGTHLTLDEVGILRDLILRRETHILNRYKLDSPSLRFATEIMLGTGLRISEALAFRHRDVDLEAGTVDVNGQLIVKPAVGVVRTAVLKGKKKQSRVIEVPEFCVEALRQARVRCETVPSRQPDRPAMQSEVGTWVNPRNLRRSMASLERYPEWKRVLADVAERARENEDADAETVSFTPHMLRRTVATLLAEELGSSEIPQALLGHQHAATTEGRYISGSFRRVSEAKAPLQKLLGAGLAS